MIKHIESGIGGRMQRSRALFDIRDTATKLKINGVAFIQEDGSIKIIAEGEEKNLEEFAKKIERGSFFATVENFYVKWSDMIEGLKNFYAVIH